MSESTVPIEQYFGFISEEIYNRPEHHQQFAQATIPSTHTMVSFSAERSSTDPFTGEKRFALVVYAYKSQEKP